MGTTFFLESVHKRQLFHEMDHDILHEQVRPRFNELLHVASPSPIIHIHSHAHVGISERVVAATLDLRYLTGDLEVFQLQFLDGEDLLELLNRFLINFIAVHVVLFQAT